MQRKIDKLKLILASGSPRRKQLLNFLNIPFEIISADIDESSTCDSPEKQCVEISEKKGSAVFNKLDNPSEYLVISSDTMVVLRDKIYGKPHTVEKAKEMLLELSGNTHEVITAVSFINKTQGVYSFYDKTKVTFDTIESELLSNYLQTEDSLDKAGAYGIQGPSLTFISRIEGSYSNVVGFPLNLVAKKLKEKGYWTKLV